ncbi:MAG: hypothetical protein WCR56_07115 [Bacilli bacterium]
MKTAAKIFVILGMVGGVIIFALYLILGIIGLSQGTNVELSGMAFSGAVVCGLSVIGLIPFIVGFFSLKKLKTATSHDGLVGMGVVTLLFCSLVGGILMLCIPDSDLKK